MNIKVKLICFMLALMVALSACGVVKKEESAGKVVDGKEVVAKVNDEYILKSDFEKQLKNTKEIYEANGHNFTGQDGKNLLEEVKKEVLESMINQEVILQQAKKQNIKATDEELEEGLKQQEEMFGGKEALDKYLKEQGVSRDELKKQKEGEIIFGKLYEKATKDVNTSDEEIKEVYDGYVSPQVKASHILVKEKKDAEKILSELKNGADFAELAKKHSICPSKDKGGDLGYFGKAAMVSEFSKVAFTLKPGELSDIVKTEHGYHIIKVSDVKETKFEDVKEQIKLEILAGKKNDEFVKNFAEWKKQSKVEKYM